MAAPSTRQELLSLVEDVEIVTKELFDVLSTPKQQRPEGIDTGQLIDLLIQKEKEIQKGLKTAREQADLQKKMDALKSEVDRRDQDIKQLQRSLKEAESILANAIYQAKQKLYSINQADRNQISSEELIKYAHKISATNAVMAPPTWAPGDPRRPYPTDMEMRYGFLGKLGDQPINSQLLQSQASFSDCMSARGSAQIEHMPSSTSTSSLSWQPSVELGSMAAAGQGSGVDSKGHGQSQGHNKENEDVEIMSSDSSSSSSSDE